jgi:hypothetical protein
MLEQIEDTEILNFVVVSVLFSPGMLFETPGRKAC